MWCCDYETHLSWIGGVFSGGIPPLLLGLAVLLVLFLLIALGRSRRTRRSPRNRDRAHSLEILKGRYAKGEITEDDFLKMKRALKGSH